MRSTRIDLNCDVGESFGAYRVGNDEALMALVTSASIACGYHSGGPLVMGGLQEAFARSEEA